MKKTDKSVKIHELRDITTTFMKERDWEQFHTPKEMAVALSIEVGELLELFLWKKDKEIALQLAKDKQFKECVEDEFADIFLTCLELANNLDIDISTIFLNKLKKIERKYPIEKSKGNKKKYTEL